MAEIKIIGLEKLTRMAERYPAVASKHIGRAINRSLVRIWGNEKQEAPVGISGSLRDRWSLKASSFSGFLRSQMPYAMAVHEGTSPHYVSAEAIAPWARKKGLNPWAVAKSISKKGTKANPFFTRAVESSADEVNKEFKDALVNITKEIA